MKTREAMTALGAGRYFVPAAIALNLILIGPPTLAGERQEEKKASTEDLPKAEAVIEKMIEVTGGRAAYEKVSNRVVKATFSVPLQGMTGDLVIYEAAPDRHAMKLEIENIGSIERGYDGKVLWEKHPFMGLRILDGDEKANRLRHIGFNADLRWRELYDEVECTGLEDVDGTSCYKIVLTPKGGDATTWFIDKSTGRRAKTMFNFDTPSGSLPVEMMESDFREVDGISFPHRFTERVSGVEQVVTIESVEQNVDLPADTFKLPEEVQALVDARKSGKKTAQKD